MGHKDGRQLGADDAIMVQQVYRRIEDDEVLGALMRMQIAQMEAARQAPLTVPPLTTPSETEVPA